MQWHDGPTSLQKTLRAKGGAHSERVCDSVLGIFSRLLSITVSRFDTFSRLRTGNSLIPTDRRARILAFKESIRRFLRKSIF